ncbi:tRNA lysidine(34) synthetase TilS [Pseudoduganella ginsengisoli]|uniref:tRNA(Ile)-lysidine synthase n=1 Tax=Pseudoduganella ginsengisoli TaxID=1462440 RepID=A0A6L6Q448_9BURK|nr:tRNA lysidine(34) synthetase TilS [Pseudoduganella ginsengisoli]MTW04597.1 tRNA lysidine(34) synthetase TilS [Pseudoduganella ginsengisoli]
MKKTASLDAQFAASLSALPHNGKLAIAYSGGLDSSVLLRIAHDWAKQNNVALYAFHVHHGISPNADSWLAHCEQQCAALNVTFAASRIALQDAKKSGVEAAARKQRYAALGAMCREHGVPLLLTAHHLDDQAETVLLQMLRGSGTAGLSGMDTSNHARDLLQNDALLLARPLLAATREQLEAFQQAHAVAHIDDESNADPRYARNALRHLVMPALAQHFPGYQQRFARSAQHAQSAQRLLDELADQDLATALAGEGGSGDTLSVAYLHTLSADRNYNLLRRWFSLRGLAMPSTAWLHEMLEQLLSAGEDTNLCVTHPECEVRRHRGRLLLAPRLPELAGMREDKFDDAPEQAFRWQGEAQLAFPDYGGVLHIEETLQGGLDAAWLQAQKLTIGFRSGGETLKPAHNRPTRALKRHYQALGIPAWERERLPVVKAAGELLFAAGIGMDCRHLVEDGGKRVLFRWVAK